MCCAWEYLKYVVVIAAIFGREGRVCAFARRGAAATPASRSRREILHFSSHEGDYRSLT